MMILIDTNVVLDFALERPPFFEDAKQIFKAIDEQIIMGCLLASSITDIYYFLSKDKGTGPAASFILNLVQIMQVIALDKDSILNALDLNWPDFEDALQYYGGKTVSASSIITRNPKDFTRSDIPIYTPDQFIPLFSKEK